MKAQRVLGTLWLAFYSFAVVLWLWRLAVHQYLSSDPGMEPPMIPVYWFGVVASVFLIRGARWAQRAIGILALLLFVAVVRAYWKSGWHWDWDWPRWLDTSICLFSLASAAILLPPRRQGVAEPLSSPRRQ